MRIVFARALDNVKSALVIEILGQYRAGVVYITRLEERIHQHVLSGQDRIFGYTEQHEMQLWLVWDWYEIVTSPEEFMDQRGWEHPPSQRQIEKPVPMISAQGDNLK